MATRSTISVQHKDGSVSQVYCHFDGYINGVGFSLKNNYKTLDLVEELVSFGDMSSLGEKINPQGKHSYDLPEDGITVYYGRDRGEEGTKPRKFSDLDIWKLTCQLEEYQYIFIEDEWKLFTRDKQIVSFKV